MHSYSRADEIMDVAERIALSSGYNSFSFRDIASATGLTSASIHYHFPTKEDLAVALVQRNAQRFVEKMGAIGAPRAHPLASLRNFIALFQEVARGENATCLFVIYSAEIYLLPSRLQSELLRLHLLVVSWLSAALTDLSPGKQVPRRIALARARVIVAALEGALIAVRIEGDCRVLDQIIRELAACGLIPKRAVPPPARSQAPRKPAGTRSQRKPRPRRARRVIPAASPAAPRRDPQ